MVGRLQVRVQVHVRALRERTRTRVREIGERSPRPLRALGELAWRTAREVRKDRVAGLAAEAALFTLISLPALLLVVLGSLGFIADSLGSDGVAELRRIVFEVPGQVLSERTYDAYAVLAEEVLAGGRADVVSLGAVLSLWTGSRATGRYLETITLAYDLEPRAGWRRRLLALVITLTALVGAVAVLPFLVLGPRLVSWLAPETVAQPSLDLLGTLYWPSLGVLVVAALTTLFHVGVPWHTPWHRDLPGALLAMLLWLVAAGSLRAYLAVSLRDDAVYSQLGTPIAVVLWLYVTAFAVLLGAELNAEIEKKWPTRRKRDQHEGG